MSGPFPHSYVVKADAASVQLNGCQCRWHPAWPRTYEVRVLVRQYVYVIASVADVAGERYWKGLIGDLSIVRSSWYRQES